MILVLGATGRVGSLVVAQLVAAGLPVRCLVRDAAKARSLWPVGVEAVAGDLSDATSIASAMHKVSRVFVSSPIHPMMAQWQLGAVRLAVEAGVRRIVKLSGSRWTMLPGDATTVGAAHAAVEAEIERGGVDHVCIRPNAFTQGMLGRIVSDLAAGDTFSLAIGDAQVSFADVRDIAAACARALSAEAVPPPRIEITGPLAIGGAGLAGVLQGLLKRPISYQPISVDEALARARAGGATDFTIVHQREVLLRIRFGAACATSAAFESLCGRPALAPEVFLAEAVAPNESRGDRLARPSS